MKKILVKLHLALNSFSVKFDNVLQNTSNAITAAGIFMRFLDERQTPIIPEEVWSKDKKELGKWYQRQNSCFPGLGLI